MSYTIPKNQEKNFDFESAVKITEKHGVDFRLELYDIDGGMFTVWPPKGRDECKKQIRDCFRKLIAVGYADYTKAAVYYTRYNTVVVPYRQTVSAVKMKNNIVKRKIRGIIGRAESFRDKTIQSGAESGISFDSEAEQINAMIKSLEDRLENI
jgi:hypothetical protein